MEIRFVQISLQKRGAAAIDAFELSEAFCRRQFRHSVVLSSANELKHLWSENEFRKIFWADTYKSSLLSFFFWTLLHFRISKIIRLIQAEKPNVVFATHFHPWLYFIFKRLRAKKILGVHEDPFASKESDRVTKAQTKLLGLADTIVSHSNFIKSQLGKNTSKPVISIPLGSYESSTKGFSKPNREEAKKFLFFGRIAKYKGLQTLAEAFEIVSKNSKGARLTVAGNGFIHPKILEKLLSMDAAVINRWTGFNEMCGLFQSHDVLIVPYSQASQSGVISLALAFNMPVIASRVGGLPEQVLDSGLLVEPQNPIDLAKAMASIYNDKELYQKLVAGCDKTKQSLSWDVAATIIIQNLE